ncbi:MAG: hypothetical protein LBQ87_01825 [Candidatus Fibromonas sp.]|jgi:hypothetical protein|nr:hypothetical protein [Candidatus Fibromonas sp.]
MVKRISLLLVLLLLCSEAVWAQRAKAIAQEDDRTARRQWEEDQRADEYANSLRRRDWLKDRLILELGMGTKFPVMGANWFGFGAGVEYITRWHVSAFLTGGLIPAHDDPALPEYYSLDGGSGWRIGLAYYMFPKSPIHLGVQFSYGTVYYDHVAAPSDLGNPEKGVRELITCLGYELDLSITYLSDQWYFLQALLGVYNIGNGWKDGGDKEGWTSGGRRNGSWDFDAEKQEFVSKVTTDSRNKDEAIPPVGVVFGIGIGFAFEEFFPDDTEIRRREREGTRSKQNQFRSGSTTTRKAGPASKKSSPIDDDYEDE